MLILPHSFITGLRCCCCLGKVKFKEHSLRAALLPSDHWGPSHRNDKQRSCHSCSVQRAHTCRVASLLRKQLAVTYPICSCNRARLWTLTATRLAAVLTIHIGDEHTPCSLKKLGVNSQFLLQLSKHGGLSAYRAHVVSCIMSISCNLFSEIPGSVHSRLAGRRGKNSLAIR